MIQRRQNSLVPCVVSSASRRLNRILSSSLPFVDKDSAFSWGEGLLKFVCKVGIKRQTGEGLVREIFLNILNTAFLCIMYSTLCVFWYLPDLKGTLRKKKCFVVFYQHLTDTLGMWGKSFNIGTSVSKKKNSNNN